MITLIFGRPGAGKTALMTHRAIKAMTDPAITHQDLFNCKKIIKKLNSGGGNYTVPEKHLVYSDYYILGKKYPQIQSYQIDGHKVSLPNDEKETHFFPPHSHIFLDESQRKLNSREGGIKDPNISYFYEIHRHLYLDITLTCQRERLIDLNVRELADKILEVIGMKHKYDRYGTIIQTTWSCLEFKNCFAVEQYLNNGKNTKYGSIVKYTHVGNIFKHYDPYGYMSKFFYNNYDKDFDRTPSLKPKLTIDFMREYNTIHPITTTKRRVSHDI